MALTEIKTSGIADDAVTTDKLANAINTARDANTAKATNATHSGDVTGSGSLTIADNAVTLAKMAGGTDGQIITYDASGDPVAVGPGTDGQVLTSTGAGSPPAFEAIPAAGAALTGSTDNTICTVTGANAIQGEANLTFDGSTLGVTGDVTLTNTSSNPQLALIAAANGTAEIQFGDAADATRANIVYKSGTAGDALCFHGYNNAERLRLDSSGNVGIGLTSPGLKFHIQDGALSSAPTPNSNCDMVVEGTTNTGIQFLSSGQAQLRFGDAGSTAAGAIIYNHSDDNFKLNYSNSGALTFNDGSGEVGRFTPDGLTFNGDTAAANALDDYEEGTFTAAYYYADGTHMGDADGRYTKIGNTVRVSVFEFAGSAASTTDKDMSWIQGFPFNCRSEPNSVGTIVRYGGGNNATISVSESCYLAQGGTRIKFDNTFNTGSGNWTVSLVYETDA